VLHQWKRGKLSRMLEDQYLLPAFVDRVREKVTATSKGIPPYHRQQLLRDLNLPSEEASNKEKAAAGRSIPLYLYLPHDLPRAGVLFRAPYLRLQHRGVFEPRARCAWCDEYDSEYGYHLVRCSRMPPRLRILQDRALSLIQKDVDEQHRPLRSETNLHRLYSLSWDGGSTWIKNRPDRQHQPSKQALCVSLLYMRETINEYATSTAGSGHGGTDPVWQLPIYLDA
jgi:hypothetical protein